MENNETVDDDLIDPRIKHELECLNSTSKKINELENMINERRSQYHAALTTSSQQLNSLAHKLGYCIKKARPYYEAKRVAKTAHNEAQDAALKFERAVSMHTAAREMVSVAERGMVNDRKDSAWAEMLNHATVKVNEAETDRFQSGAEHLKRADAFKVAEDEVKQLQKKLKSSIKKSHPYFDKKKQAQEQLKDITCSVNEIHEELKSLKQLYSITLRKLETISDSIHASRRNLTKAEKSSIMLGQRQQGVGAEAPFSEEDIVAELKKVVVDKANVLSEIDDSDSLDSTCFNNIDTASSGGASCSSSYVLDNVSYDISNIANIKRPQNEGMESTTGQANNTNDLNDTNVHANLDTCKPTLEDKQKVLSSIPSTSKQYVKLASSSSIKSSSNSHSSQETGSSELVLTVAGLGEISKMG